MSRTIEKAGMYRLPVIPLRGITAFPKMPISFELEREVSKNACNASLDNDTYILLLSQKDIAKDNIESPDDLYTVGCIAEIKQSLKTYDGNIRVTAEGVFRGEVFSLSLDGSYISADVVMRHIVTDNSSHSIKTQALMREALSQFEKTARFIPALQKETVKKAKLIPDPGFLADYIASNCFVKYQDKQKVLECFDPSERLETVSVLIESEMNLIKTEADIQSKVRDAIDENQRDYYLREQLKVIQGELGADSDDDVSEYLLKAEESNLPENVKAKILKEINRFSKIPFGSPEATVSRGYLDTVFDIPWNVKTEDKRDIAEAERILNADHDGLEKVKERILEYLAVRTIYPDVKNQILCLVGPPGVGKTSLGRSVASALGRKYARVSLGGVRDESDIRGHRKTYIGSMPGRIINALVEAGSMNPVIQLDEIDKLGQDIHGDPASALLEVLDSEQNKEFRDHFIELPVDLSDVMFIASANTLDTVPSPLIDRMEIIELSTYTAEEKFAIARNHLIPRQLKAHGLTKSKMKITDDSLRLLIKGYTREAGVRNLEREIASLCRKTAKILLTEGKKSITITPGAVRKMLGCVRFEDDFMSKDDLTGVVNGLAYTELGGDVLKVETAVMPGSGKIEMTGTLGDVMKESAKIAYSLTRALAESYDIKEEFWKTKDVHIHVPEGAVPKDGPSAGVTLTTSLVSALSGRKVRHDIAMTGEVTLTGRVLPIGGLREKSTAAYVNGIKTILIPEGNYKDIEKVPKEVSSSVEFIPMKTIEDVLRYALVPEEKSSRDEKLSGKNKMDKFIPVNNGYVMEDRKFMGESK